MKNKILGLDGIRAFAVLAVVATHLGIHAAIAKKIPQQFMLPFSGSTAVGVFFVLSGFLITTLLVREYEANGRVSIKNFYIRRTLRIFPLYFLVVGLTALLTYFGYTSVQPEGFYYAFTFTYNFVPREYYNGLLGHTWSLAVEEHFYLVWPVVFSLFFGKKTRWLVCLSIVCIFLAIYAQDVLLRPYERRFSVSGWTITAGMSICVGAIAALMLESGRNKHLVQALFKHRIALLLGCAAYLHTYFFGVMSNAGLRTSIIAVGAALIIAWVSLNQSSSIVRVLEFRPLRYIGVISYGVYMWQGFFLSTGPAREPGIAWPIASPIGLALLCIVAPLSYHFFEKPILKLKRGYEPKRASTSQIAIHTTT